LCAEFKALQFAHGGGASNWRVGESDERLVGGVVRITE
jgi:hypothetical protein